MGLLLNVAVVPSSPAEHTERLTVFGGEDFLVCDQFLTKTHHKVDVLRSSALCLLPLLVIPVVYSAETKEENVQLSCCHQ